MQLALKFNCPQCNAILFSRHLRQGELAECTECGARFAARAAVSAGGEAGDGAGGEAQPGAAEPHAGACGPSSPGDADRDLRMICPRCRTHCDQGAEVCPSCNLRFSEISLYSPRHFVWLSLLFSFLMPLYLSAVNHGRLGDRRKRNLMLILGTGAFVVIVMGFSSLEEFLISRDQEAESAMRMFGKLFSWVVNWPVALILKSRQEALFEKAMGVGIRKASLFKGVLKGIGLGAAVAVPILIIVGVFFMDDPETRAMELMDEDEFTAAVTILDSLHAEYPDDVDLLYQRVRALLGCCRFTEAEADLKVILEERPNHAPCHLMMGMLLVRRGLEEEGAVHLVVADSLQPGILEEYLEHCQQEEH